ncbi:hypothetical protein [Desulfoluna spongiiphila]|uniref:MazG nucleotide pyrophosphohydrolase domain-containing protein n=1 Tax=Desulfoluna spongiiphila TaxID=419481 RepID=A0A1G5G3B8_9BACT|nr:hypothetical protein [Desulfoluna spongiiphila]SCY45228.1 hypothetical protein SAMN05216233_109137 [Desulfoluna spongiiphila]VVS95328.1 hypothetical protein DBB_49050 [Desulfoluna spongiiphila]
MKFIDYQSAAAATCLPLCFSGAYLRPGLLNEAGEICGQFKRLVRGDIQFDTAKHLAAKEIGDVLWYVAMWGAFKGIDTEDISLRAELYHPRIDSVSELEELAADIVADVCIFRMAPTHSQLTGLLLKLEKLANAIGFSLHEVAVLNQKKLKDRKHRNVIQGMGDVR